MNCRIFVCGPPRHGKDTFARYLAEAMGLPWGGPGSAVGSTSDAIYARMAELRGVSEGELRALPKEDLRPDLVALGDEMVKDDLAALVKALPDRVRIVTGVRRAAEFEAVPHPKVLVWMAREGGPRIVDNTERALEEMADVSLVFREGDFHGMKSCAAALVEEFEKYEQQLENTPGG